MFWYKTFISLQSYCQQYFSQQWLLSDLAIWDTRQICYLLRMIMLQTFEIGFKMTFLITNGGFFATIRRYFFFLQNHHEVGRVDSENALEMPGWSFWMHTMHKNGTYALQTLHRESLEPLEPTPAGSSFYLIVYKKAPTCRPSTLHVGY